MSTEISNGVLAKWISVEEKLPPSHTDVLVWIPTRNVRAVGYMHGGDWYVPRYGNQDVSLWWPLPEFER